MKILAAILLAFALGIAVPAGSAQALPIGAIFKGAGQAGKSLKKPPVPSSGNKTYKFEWKGDLNVNRRAPEPPKSSPRRSYPEPLDDDDDDEDDDD